MLSDVETCLQDKLLSILEYTLSKLARYDEGNPIGALLSIAPKPNSIFNKMKNLVGEQNMNAITGSQPQPASSSQSQVHLIVGP